MAAARGIEAGQHTDGLDVTTTLLGPPIPEGILVVEDDYNDGHRQNHEQETLLVAGLGLRALIFGHGLSGFLVWGRSSTPALKFHERPSCAGLDGRPYMNPVTGRDHIRPSRRDGNAEGAAAPRLIRATRRAVQ